MFNQLLINSIIAGSIYTLIATEGIEFIWARITPVQIGIIATGFMLLLLVLYLVKSTKVGTAWYPVRTEW